MNSLELTMEAMKGIPEKIPFNPFLMHLAASMLGVDYCHEYCQKPEILAEAQVKTANFFGIDHVNVSTDAYRTANAWGVELNWDGNTPTAKTNLKWEEFESIEAPDLLSSTRVQNRLNAVKLLKEKVGSNNCVVGWLEAPFAEICCLFDMINVLLIARRKDDWDNIIRKLIKRVLPTLKEFAELQIEAGADIMGLGDSAISQIGPMRYESCCVDATRELFGHIKRDVPVLYHVCGDNAIVDREGRDMIKLISSTNADIIDFDYQVGLKEAKEKCGDNNCIRGNTNTQILGSNSYSSDDVIREVIQTIKDGKPNGRFMYAAGCEWPWKPLNMSVRNMGIAKALVERLGKY
ncbi:MAG: uroporphyrinogen decarboxylase family protein [Promethearchaeota archaeon]